MHRLAAIVNGARFIAPRLRVPGDDVTCSKRESNAADASTNDNRASEIKKKRGKQQAGPGKRSIAINPEHVPFVQFYEMMSFFSLGIGIIVNMRDTSSN